MSTEINPTHFIRVVSALALLPSTDSVLSGGLQAIYVDTIQGARPRFSLAATDGHILAVATYESEDWEAFTSAVRSVYNVKLPGSPTKGFLVDNKKFRYLFEDLIFCPESEANVTYPNYMSLVPDNNKLHNELSKRPVFGFRVLDTLNKFFKKLGDKRNYFVPDYWGERTGSTYTRLNDSMELVVMPMRVEGFEP